MPFNTKNIKFDKESRPIPQYFNPRADDYEPAHGDGGAINISSMQRKWRDDFPGSALDPANWQTVATGSGHTIAVSGSVLSIATGTTINTETILRSMLTYTVPFRVMYIFMLSQRIANQEFYLEITNAAGTMLAQWLLDDISATVGKHNSANANTAGTAASVTIATTASYAIAELELFPDEVYFHSRGANSSAVRTLSAVRSRLVPDPNELYFVQIRARNLGVAPGSSTTLFVDAVTVQDIAELTAEITAGRGAMVGSQAIAVQAVGGTIGTVSTVTTATTLTTGNIQSIQTQFTDSTTALAAGATFTGTTRDITTTPRRNRVTARAFADQAGTLFIEQSRDSTTWRNPATHSVAVAVGETRQLTVDIVTRYWRVRYLNGATLQGAFELLSAEFGV